MNNQPTDPTGMPAPDEKPVYVNRMFARIAPTYDLMNRLMTLGQDQGWRREPARCLRPAARTARLLDVGTGTGDIAYAAMQRVPGVRAVGADFTYEMMAAGVGKSQVRHCRLSRPTPMPCPLPTTPSMPSSAAF